MKTIIYVIVFLLTSFVTIQAQESKKDSRWYSTASLDFVFVDKMSYFYYDVDHSTDIEIEPMGFKLKSFAAQYAYNYVFF